MASGYLRSSASLSASSTNPAALLTDFCGARPRFCADAVNVAKRRAQMISRRIDLERGAIVFMVNSFRAFRDDVAAKRFTVPLLSERIARGFHSLLSCRLKI